MVAAQWRGFATKNTRYHYERIAKDLETEARAILEKVRTYTGPARHAPRSFSPKGAPALVFETEE